MTKQGLHKTAGPGKGDRGLEKRDTKRHHPVQRATHKDLTKMSCLCVEHGMELDPQPTARLETSELDLETCTWSKGLVLLACLDLKLDLDGPMKQVAPTDHATDRGEVSIIDLPPPRSC